MRPTRELGWMVGGYLQVGLWMSQDDPTFLALAGACLFMMVGSYLTREPVQEDV